MQLFTRHIKLGVDLKEKIDSNSTPNSEIIRRICRQIRSYTIIPSNQKVKMNTPVIAIDAELERWMFGIEQHVIRNGLQMYEFDNTTIELDIDKADLVALYGIKL